MVSVYWYLLPTTVPPMLVTAVSWFYQVVSLEMAHQLKAFHVSLTVNKELYEISEKWCQKFI